MNYWLPVVVIGLGTLIYRLSFFGGLVKFTPPRQLKKALEYVPVSVMAALVGLGFFINAEGAFSLYGPSLAAAAVATAVAVSFRRDLLTIIIGLAVYWGAEKLLL